MCTICHGEKETIERAFMSCDCDRVQSFQKNVHYLEKNQLHLPQNLIIDILNKCKDILNVIFLCLKYYIYTAMYTEEQLSVSFAMSFLKLFFETEFFFIKMVNMRS